MNSLRAGVANCSSHTVGCTPVSHKSAAMSLASCHPGVMMWTRCASSSKQNRKKRCGYQWRQKCQNFCVSGDAELCGAQMRFWTRHSETMMVATTIWRAIKRSGWATFWAKDATRMVEMARYPRAIHSNAPHAAAVDSQARCPACASWDQVESQTE